MKRGFTLVELMAVIIILAVISLIVFPTMVKTISKAKEDLYQNQIETLEKASKDWSVKNTDKLPEEDNSDMCYIKIGTLSLEGFIENKEVENPETGEPMTGCVLVRYNTTYNQYEFTYNEDENSCSGLQINEKTVSECK